MPAVPSEKLLKLHVPLITPQDTLKSGLIGDNFVRANSSSVGNSWTDVQTGVFSIASNLLSCSNSAPAGTAYLRDYCVRPSTENLINQHVEAVTTMPSDSAASVAVVLRYQSSTKNCYLVSLSGAMSGNLTIAVYSIVGGAVGGTLVGTRPTNIIAPSSANLRVRFVAEATGSSPTTLKIRIYNESNGAILDNTTLTDATSTLQSSGATGICSWALTAPQAYEEFLSSIAVPQPSFNIVFEGDSITRGDQASSGIGTCFGITYPAVTLNGLGSEWSGVNIGISGQSSSTMDTQAIARANSNKVSNAQNVMILMCGTNDIGTGGTTPSAVWSNIQSILSKWRSRGYKVVVCTLLPAANVAYASTFNTNRTLLNGIIRSNWTGPADGICDLGNHWLIAQNGSESRRLLFSTDRTHPNDEGNKVLGLMVADAVKRIQF